MNLELRQLIEELRAELADSRTSLAYAEFGEGAAIDAVPAGLPADLRDLLLVADGLRAGRVELASSSTLAGVQYHLDYAPDFSTIPRGPGGLAGGRRPQRRADLHGSWHGSDLVLPTHRHRVVHVRRVRGARPRRRNPSWTTTCSAWATPT